MGVRLAPVLTVLAALVLAPSAVADVTQSTNWAGYAVHRTGPGFRAIEAWWRQPVLRCSRAQRTFSSYWVGLGGYSATSQALEQVGTEADCNASGRMVSNAWYELIPAPSVPIALVPAPGDLMAAEVVVRGHLVSFSLQDVTRGRSFSRTVRAGAVDVSSGEWIVEAPSDCVTQTRCVTLPLADFGSASFEGAAIQSARGRWGAISDPSWPSTRISLNPSSRVFVASGAATSLGRAVASPLGPGGRTFSVSYSPLQVGVQPLALHGAVRLLGLAR